MTERTLYSVLREISARFPRDPNLTSEPEALEDSRFSRLGPNEYLPLRTLEDSEVPHLALYGTPEIVASRRARHIDAQIDAYHHSKRNNLNI